MPPATRNGGGIECRRTESRNPDVGSSALFAPVHHPVLRSIDPQRVAVFLKDRERYVDEVMEKRKHVPTMSVASFKISVDRRLLKTMHGLGRLRDVAPDIALVDVTSDHVELYIGGIVNKSAEKEVSPTVIQDALKGVRMPMSVSAPEAGVLEYVHDVFERLEGVSYGYFKERNPEKTVILLQASLYPAHLKSAMHIDYQQGVRKRVNEYVSLLCKEAAIQDRIKIDRGRNGISKEEKNWIFQTERRWKRQGQIGHAIGRWQGQK